MGEAAVTAAEAERVAKAAEALAGAVVPRGEFDRQTRRQRVANGVLILAVLGLGFLALSNRSLVDELHAQTDLLTECTTEDPDPGDGDPHECFEQSQQRQSDAIAELVERMSENFSTEITRQIDRVLRSVGVEPLPT